MGTIVSEMNRLAGTTGLEAQGAAQIWANSVVPPSSSTTGWTNNPAVTLSDNGDHLRGTLVTTTIAALAQNIRVLSVPAVAGRTYRGVAQGRTNTAAGMLMRIEFFDASLVSLGSTDSPTTTLNSVTFTQLGGLVAVAPANTESLIFYLGLGATGARSVGQTFDVRRAALLDGTNGGRALDLVGALNHKNESSGVGLDGVLNQLAETQGLEVDGAASRIVA